MTGAARGVCLPGPAVLPGRRRFRASRHGRRRARARRCQCEFAAGPGSESARGRAFAPGRPGRRRISVAAAHWKALYRYSSFKFTVHVDSNLNAQAVLAWSSWSRPGSDGNDCHNCGLSNLSPSPPPTGIPASEPLQRAGAAHHDPGHSTPATRDSDLHRVRVSLVDLPASDAATAGAKRRAASLIIVKIMMFGIGDKAATRPDCG